MNQLFNADTVLDADDAARMEWVVMQALEYAGLSLLHNSPHCNAILNIAMNRGLKVWPAVKDEIRIRGATGHAQWINEQQGHEQVVEVISGINQFRAANWV